MYAPSARRRSRLPLLAVLLALFPACDREPPTSTPVDEEADLNAGPPGRPLSSLGGAQRQLFERGRAVFTTVFTPETGLGPLFNADACSECHESPVVGGVGLNEQGGEDVEIHATAFTPPATCDALSGSGGAVFQREATPALQAAGIDHEAVPAGAQTAFRTTPDLFGFGLLDAVPDAAIQALADPDDSDGDGISGRPNQFFDGRLGRFGRKALIPTLREFTAGAFVLEQGITNPEFAVEELPGGQPMPSGVDPLPEPELTQEALDAANAFVQFLAPPGVRPLGLLGRVGRVVFSQIGCAECHVPALRTGAHPERALRQQWVHAYTDLLLHDMGPELADICLGLAEPAEFRTEPLMGLRFSLAFLHDGRAATIEDAIELHGGEAAASRDRFLALSAGRRAALLRFLGSL